jgi:3-hydroxyacyl-CoA dehydrogenase/enoyl-CoA hydratase/3-hydroxybutyryl-CoA epimerase
MNLNHWKIEVDQDNISWWWLDRKDTSTNTLGEPVLLELEVLIDDASKNSALRGIIIGSAKSSGFIAGADINQIATLKTEEEAFTLIRKGQLIFNKLEALTIPTVAMIEGFCMGGGTELSLACKFRVVEDGPKTRIGLPEIKLGLQPGWGGTIRLPLLIGVLKAMNIILTGNPVNAKAALKLGMIDAAVPKRHLLRAAKTFILENPSRHQVKGYEKIFNWPLLRPLIGKFLRHKISKHARPEHYPAPYAIINLWEKDGCIASDAMENEAKSLAKLRMTDTSENLIRVFFLQEKLKGLSKGINFKAQHAHIVGAGTMGGDIAAVCALRGLKVTLQDRDPKYIAPAIKRAYELFKYKLKEPRLIQAAMDRLAPDVEGRGISHADIIIEAIFEDDTAKQNLFKLLEEKAKPDAILATNTSSIALSSISKVMKNPERLVGIHFFNPVAKMPLVEVVWDDKTDKNNIQKSIAFVRQLDKLPLPVKSAPGFLVNRILMPYLMGAMKMVKEGIPPESIDEALLKFGMPMGPIELADTVGLDICLSVAKHLSKENEDFNFLEKMISEKKLGRKSGEGFYQYKNGRMIKNKSSQETTIPITDRLISAMINEATKCLEEKIVESEDLLDAGMIFGIGFAPFRGGLLRYAESIS